MRPFHLLQFVALAIAIVLMLRTPAAPESIRWYQSAAGWLGAIGILLVVLFALGSGAVGLLVGLRMRSIGNMVLALATIGAGLTLMVRGLFLPLR